MLFWLLKSKKARYANLQVLAPVSNGNIRYFINNKTVENR